MDPSVPGPLILGMVSYGAPHTEGFPRLACEFLSAGDGTDLLHAKPGRYH